MRYKEFGYNSIGVYFITICTKNKQCILSEIVGTSVERANSSFSHFISTFKRFCNKEYGKNIWQARSYDHIIRNYEDYKNHIKYIYENPAQWYFDELYSNK
jgi:REP element-mobilizing transposase RayT